MGAFVVGDQALPQALGSAATLSVAIARSSCQQRHFRLYIRQPNRESTITVNHPGQRAQPPKTMIESRSRDLDSQIPTAALERARKTSL
jgi:hypothetical protein